MICVPAGVDPGRAPRDPRNRAIGRRREARLPGRGADGGRDRCRHAGDEPTGSWSSISAAARRKSPCCRSRGLAYTGPCASAATRWTKHRCLCPPQPQSLIGEATAERIKKKSASPGPRRGERQDGLTSRARPVERRAQGNLDQRAPDRRGARRAREDHRQRREAGARKTPPELAADIADKGIMLPAAARCSASWTKSCAMKPGWRSRSPRTRSAASRAAPDASSKAGRPRRSVPCRFRTKRRPVSYRLCPAPLSPGRSAT